MGWGACAAVLGSRLWPSYGSPAMVGLWSQAWHCDGGHLFNRKIDCPPHCLDVFIPLIDVPPELGPTEFIPSTHTLVGAAEVESVLNDKGAEALSKSLRYNPALTAGTAILYDHRYAGDTNSSWMLPRRRFRFLPRRKKTFTRINSH